VPPPLQPPQPPFLPLLPPFLPLLLPPLLRRRRLRILQLKLPPLPLRQLRL
jgi:hypothetical protein